MSTPLTPPQIPNSRFVRHLGSGGFADVYLYRQQMPQRDVAVKVLRPGSSDEQSAAFEAEVNLIAQVSHHPSIVSFYSAATTDDGRSYLVMEYCPPPHLGKRAQETVFPVSQVLDIGVRIAGAVETLHRRGILHRDIKPMNILFTQFGHPVLTDFGIAVSTQSGYVKESGFSVPWAPPEQHSGDGRFSPALDVYSLAATLHTVLTGHSPFAVPGGDNREFTLLNRILHQQVPPTGRADVPAELERILAIAMSKDPAKRYKSAQEFALALQQVQVSLYQTPTPFEVEELQEPITEDDSDHDDRTAAAPIVMIDPRRAPSAPVQPTPPAWSQPSASVSMATGSPISPSAPAVADRFGRDDADERTVTRSPSSPGGDETVRIPAPVEPALAVTLDDDTDDTQDDEPAPRPRMGALIAGAVLALLFVGGIGFGVWTYLLGEGGTLAPTTTDPVESPIDGLPDDTPGRSVTGLIGSVGDDGVTFTWDSFGEGTTYLYHVEDPLTDTPVRQTTATSVTIKAVPGRTCLSVAVRHRDGRSSKEVIECVETP